MGIIPSMWHCGGYCVIKTSRAFPLPNTLNLLLGFQCKKAPHWVGTELKTQAQEAVFTWIQASVVLNGKTTTYTRNKKPRNHISIAKVHSADVSNNNGPETPKTKNTKKKKSSKASNFTVLLIKLQLPTHQWKTISIQWNHRTCLRVLNYFKYGEIVQMKYQ